MSDPSIFAVLTGDMIGSSKLADSALGKAQRVIRDASHEFDLSVAHGLIGRPEFFRGDAWQLLLADPGVALRLALLLRAQLRWKAPFDTRLAIGIGTVRSINRRKVSLSAGEAFELSGHALDKMTSYFELTAAVPARAPLAAQWVPGVLHLCSELLRGWTPRQAEIVCYALLQAEATHEQIGAMLDKPVRKQTVTSALRGAHFRALADALERFEGTDWNAMLEAHT